MNGAVHQYYAFGEFRLDCVKRLLFRNDKPVPLTPKVFDLLLILVQNRGRVIEKDELMSAVWPETAVEENNLTRGISTLRKVLGETADQHRYVVTIPGRGYSFVADVAELSRDERGPIAGGRSVGGRRMILAVAIAGTAISVWLFMVVSRSNRPLPFEKISIARLTNTGQTYRAAISPDAKYLASFRGEAGRQHLRIRLLATAAEVEVPVPQGAAGYGGFTFSHDSAYLYYTVKQAGQATTLYRASVLGGPGAIVTTRLDSKISLSPDGKQLAFVREYTDLGESVLLVSNADGSAERRVASKKLPELLDYPAWSPDGSRIVCSLVPASSREVVLLDVRLADGAVSRPTPYKWGYIRQLEWLHDGAGLVLSARDEKSGTFSIWHVAIPKGTVRRITNNTDSLVGVSLTADSKALVTVEDKLVSSVWVAAEGDIGHARQILVAPSRFSRAVWGPDGGILYEKQSGDRRSIWITGLDGRNQRQLTFDASTYHVSACPDARSFVYQAERSAWFEIWRMGIDGTPPLFLARTPAEAFPDCSADGQTVVYSALISRKWKSLWIVRAQAGGPVELSAGSARQPAISPGGREVAFFHVEEQGSQTGEPTGITVMPIEGQARSRVFPVPEDVYEPAGIRWTRDGRALTYVVNRDGISNIWRQPLGGGEPGQVTKFRGDSIFFFDWSRDGKNLLFSRGTRVFDAVLIRSLQ